MKMGGENNTKWAHVHVKDRVVSSTLGLLLHPGVDLDSGTLCIVSEVNRLESSFVVLFNIV